MTGDASDCPAQESVVLELGENLSALLSTASSKLSRLAELSVVQCCGAALQSVLVEREYRDAPISH
jgi:hypothetical protein